VGEHLEALPVEGGLCDDGVGVSRGRGGGGGGAVWGGGGPAPPQQECKEKVSTKPLGCLLGRHGSYR
jgi:hypothetical protein